MVYCILVEFGVFIEIPPLHIHKKGVRFAAANRDNALKSTKKKATVTGLPTADELRAALHANQDTPARRAIAALFDADTFVETAAYTKRSFNDYVSVDKDAEFEGVITGYGAINGKLVFAFAQDETRMKGAIDANHAKKIAALYDLALKKGAPVIGVFASSGAFVEEGVTALAAYGRLLKTVTDASDEISQIAYIIGTCTGTAAALASSFDFTVASDKATFYVANPELGGKQCESDAFCFRGAENACCDYIRNLIGFLPDGDMDYVENATDDLNRRLDGVTVSGDAHDLISAIADNGVYTELFADYGTSAVVALTTVAGVKCGVVANSYAVNEGRISKDAAYKMVDFLRICDCYSLPVVTLTDSNGLDADISVDAVKALAYGYTQLDVPQVTVICGHAIGAAFTLMGSKSLGAELTYTLENAEIGVLPADASVAFAWNDDITTDVTREELEAKWRASVSTAAAAAATGEVDDIIPVSELRARIASALLMLSC